MPLERSILHALDRDDSGFPTPREKLVVLEYQLSPPRVDVPSFKIRLETRPHQVIMHGYSVPQGFNNTADLSWRTDARAWLDPPIIAQDIHRAIRAMKEGFKRRHRIPPFTQLHLLAAHGYMKRFVRGDGVRFTDKRNLKQNFPRYLVPKWKRVARKRAKVRTASVALSRHGLNPNMQRKVMNMAFPARLRGAL